MTATGEIGGKKSGDARARHVLADKTSAHSQNIGIVMLARKRGGQRFGHQSAAHRRVAVDRDRDPYSRTTQRDPAFDTSIGDRGRERETVIGVINARVAVGAQVEHVMAEVGKPAGQPLFERKGGVIGCDGDAQGGTRSQ
jgi:hypothetical protein